MNKKKKKRIITEKTNIGELVRKYPQAAKILLEHGLYCVGCAAAYFETLEDVMRVHNLSKKEIDKIIEEINKSLNQ